jgi:hypothetical protein
MGLGAETAEDKVREARKVAEVSVAAARRRFVFPSMVGRSMRTHCCLPTKPPS